jgi:hypothetical protein
MKNYHFKVLESMHWCPWSILRPNPHVIDFCFAVIFCVYSQQFLLLALGEIENTLIIILIIHSIRGHLLKIIDYIERMTWSESLPSNVQLCICDNICLIIYKE